MRENGLTEGKKHRSILEPYKDEILKMKEMGLPEAIILRFLAEKKNLSVSRSTLNWFIRSRLAAGAVAKVATVKPAEKSSDDDTISRTAEQHQEPRKEQKDQPKASDPSVPARQESEPAQKRSFQWPPKFSKEDWY